MDLNQAIENVGKAVEVAGVVVTVIGIVVALAVFASRLIRPRPQVDAYRRARRDIGRSILFGLELLVAGDIIRTVVVSPTFTSVGVLAIVVVIRTFLSFTLELEITGRWPWQQEPEHQTST